MARNRWLMLAGTTAALVLAVTAFSWARASAKRSLAAWPDSTPPPSAGLLRRLAESADAFRTGHVVYIVAQDSGYYNVLGGFSSPDSAISLAHSAGPTWHVYPTLTTADAVAGGGTLAQVILPGCYKDTRTTFWICPPKDSSRVTASAMRLRDVTRIDVTFIRRASRPITISLDPQHAGATIYTVQDFDRFIVPYYTRLFGPAFAARMRADLITYASRSLADSAGGH
jgi:hypothetical protein